MEDTEVVSTADRERQLVEKFKSAKEDKAKAEAQLEAAERRLLQVESELMELLDDQGKKSSAKFEGLGHVTIPKGRIYASIIEGMHDDFFNYLKKIERTDMIKQTVHSGTLSSFVTTILEENKPLPKEVTYYEKRWCQFYPIKKKS